MINWISVVVPIGMVFVTYYSFINLFLSPQGNQTIWIIINNYIHYNSIPMKPYIKRAMHQRKVQIHYKCCAIFNNPNIVTIDLLHTV